MMSEETAFQSVGSVVTLTLSGAQWVSGSTASAAHTSVRAPGSPRRSYHDTLSFPFASALRKAGKNFHLKFGSLLSRIGFEVLGDRVPRAKLCSRMSPVGTRRASFQTILTVPAGSLTAILAKSFIGNRL